MRTQISYLRGDRMKSTVTRVRQLDGAAGAYWRAWVRTLLAITFILEPWP